MPWGTVSLSRVSSIAQVSASSRSRDKSTLAAGSPQGWIGVKVGVEVGGNVAAKREVMIEAGLLWEG
jgi:hypothetical protein